MPNSQNYYIISVSNKENLEKCIQYGIAGFTNSSNGAWTFFDIDVGDYISFLYGARIRNLYRVVDKVCYKNAETLPPWSKITFTESGKSYNFPFRLILEPLRLFDESMVRPEFTYIAENLLLRGGYRKTHFQADKMTLMFVSTLGQISNERVEKLEIEGAKCIPKIIFSGDENIPERIKFNELILQVLIKRKLSEVLETFLQRQNLQYRATDFEVLSEKALSKGFVDLFLKLKG
ncbi:MAG: hypothetical protein ACUVQF_04065 [Fervidobacterium sp.]|uniref:hypothetical protein n=1 Tax=Fervidobacterium sp. TaxID=1871331 RepID=UPI004049595F